MIQLGITKDAFIQHVLQVEVNPQLSREEHVKELRDPLSKVIEGGADWSEETVTQLLQGHWGGWSKRAAQYAIHMGFREGRVTHSFVRYCIRYERLSMLTTVAGLTEPAEYFVAGRPGEPHVGASTFAGRWLDVLANRRGDPWTSFARQVGAYATSPVGPVLADILVRHDPGHAHIEELRGTAGYALITKAFMRQRIADSMSDEPSTGVVDIAEARVGSVPASASAAPVARQRMRNL